MSLFRKMFAPMLAIEHAALRDALAVTSAGRGPLDPEASGFAEFERRGLEGAFRTAVRGRMVLLCAISIFTVWMALADPEIWRRVLLALIVVTLAALDLSWRRRFRRNGIELVVMQLNLASMVVFQIIMVLATGGLVSPMLPVLLPAAFLAGFLADRWGVRRLVFGLQLPALGCFVALHVSNLVPSLVPVPFRGDGEPSVARLVVVAIVMSILLSVFSMFGSRIRREARHSLDSLQSAQRTALAAHRQRADDLTMMSGEIAHELKNPLASVKGLTQLLARSPDLDRKNLERLGVLEREVVRMQSILDEFLNFSRPLTPLTRTPVDLNAVCSDVVSLHEAMSASLSVTIHAAVERDLSVDGDARKIGQVLINLLQNALEMAPPNSRVWLRASSTRDGADFEVQDAGPGLEVGLESAVFEPGVTTKADGNGLGLTVARAIVRQHGGSLTLANHPEGGCVARFFVQSVAPEVA